MSKITYANKVAINENANIPNINKITDDDMNEIKEVVNNNDDDLATTNANIATMTSYSTSETRVGTWIDGKPIYRIVKSFATATSKTNNSATISISTLNVDNMINIYGSTSGNFMLLGDSQAITWNANNITIYFNNSSAYSVSGYITIEYTKNTN